MTTPKKDIIYVDTEDDITSVIDKVKSAQAPIVALVPPKRVGMLQSIVNLKLLKRTAEQSKKRLVVISSDSALASLAAGVGLPIAKTLQSKPEIAPVAPIMQDDVEVIDGDELPIGVYAGVETDGEGAKNSSDVKSGASASAAIGAIAAEKASAEAPVKKSIKIPDLNAFKKKFALIGGATVLVIGFFVWAIWFAPQATVTIAAKTTPYNVSEPVTARQNVELNLEDKIVPMQVASKKQTNSKEFAATGKKEVGEYASGTVEFSTDSISRLGTTIPAGTELEAANGRTYATDQSVTISFENFRGETVGVTATDRGSAYNGASGSVSGAPAGVNAELQGSTSGGTDKTVTVVSDADVARAQDALEALDEKALRAELEEEFDDDVAVVQESFRVNPGDPVVSPAVGEEATNATVSVETTYQLVAIAKDDLQSVIEQNVKSQIEGEKDQKIYEYGVDDVRFSQLSVSEGNYSLTVGATAYVGPAINADRLAASLVDKVEGEIQEEVKTRGGVESVDVQFSPFWVNSVSSEDKITIRFEIENVE